MAKKVKTHEQQMHDAQEAIDRAYEAKVKAETKYQDAQDKLRSLTCVVCGGVGWVAFKTPRFHGQTHYKCEKCHGTGMSQELFRTVIAESIEPYIKEMPEPEKHSITDLNGLTDTMLKGISD